MSTNAGRVRMDCLECGSPCRTTTGRCFECVRSESPLVLNGGRWLNVRGVRRWVPDGKGYDWLSEQEAAERRRLARARALMDERYAEPTWFARPAGPLPASPLVAAQRIAAMVADFDEVDGRVKEVA